jgi:intein/homing endonuclease
MGLRLIDQQRDWEKLKREIVSLRNQNYSVMQIVKELKVCDKTVMKYLKESGISGRKSTRKDHFDENYFEKIDTEDKAYFLGLMYADGNVYLKRNRVQITLVNSDGYILEAFQKFIGSTSKLYSDRGKYTKIILESEKLTKHLIELGCVPNKSLVLKFPQEDQLPVHLLNHFIRGYFDGDGHVSNRKNYWYINMTSSKEFIESLIEIFDSLKIEYTGPYKRYKKNELSAHSVFIKSKSSVKFHEFLYRDATIFLKRKKEIFI